MGMFDKLAAAMKQRARKADDDRHEFGVSRPQDIVNGSPPVRPRPMSTFAVVKTKYGKYEILRLTQVLDTLEAELDNEADADILADGMRPNEAMRWLTRLRELRAKG